MMEEMMKDYVPRYSDIPDIKADGSESIRYDNPDFPLFCRRNFIAAKLIPPGMSIHWHSDLEFICIKKGSAFYQMNGCTVRMNAGEGIFVNAKQLHMLIPGEEDCVLDCIIFHPMILCASKHMEEKYVHPVISNPSVPYLLLHESTPWEGALLANLSFLYELSEQTDCELAMLKAVCDIWQLLYDNLPGIPADTGRYDGGFEIIKRMIAHIQEHYGESITLHDLCLAGGVGKTTCAKLFLKYVNATPIDYIRHYRVAKGIELLQDTDMPITKIAHETGFCGTSFFAKTFKEITGITPRQLRKGGQIHV